MRRERAARALRTAFGALAALHLAALAVEGGTGGAVAHLTKPALMPVLAGWVAARGGPRLLTAALLFGCGGDTLLQIGGEGPFLAGMGCFAAGHLAYVTLFARSGGFRGTRRVLVAGYPLLWAVAVALLWPGLGALRGPVAAYSALLTAMALGASGVSRRTGAGGALFLVSDTLIATGLAHWPQPPRPEAWIMLTYLAGQYLIATGVPAATAARDPLAPAQAYGVREPSS